MFIQIYKKNIKKNNFRKLFFSFINIFIYFFKNPVYSGIYNNILI